MATEVEALIDSRKDALLFYSPYIFIREINPQDQFNLFVGEKLKSFGTSDLLLQMEVTIEGIPFLFLYEYLPWDSDYFNRSCYKLYTVLYSQQNAKALIKAITVFKTKLCEKPKGYLFAEIPAEDIFLLQCLNGAGLKMVETRFHYFRNRMAHFDGPRFSVREATTTDIPVLAKVAADNRNNYDRLHADCDFSETEADGYLATYAEAAVQGFCDHVFVPNVPNVPVASFIAFDQYASLSPKHKLTLMYARLAAVAPENKGWYVKLLVEFMHYAKEQQTSYVKITTQSTNKTVIKTFEKLGCSFGAATHMLSFTF